MFLTVVANIFHTSKVESEKNVCHFDLLNKIYNDKDQFQAKTLHYMFTQRCHKLQ